MLYTQHCNTLNKGTNDFREGETDLGNKLLTIKAQRT